MRWFHQLWMSFVMLFRRGRAGDELDHELQFHIEQQIAENRMAGMSEEEARQAALREFGNPTALRDEARETWQWNGLEQLLRDVRQSTRSLLRTPGFSLVAIAVLALGIGANVALFTLVNSVLLKPLPFPHSERLVRVYESDSRGRFSYNIVAGGDFAEWRTGARSFEQLAIQKQITYSLSGTQGQLPEVVRAEQASWNLFPLLGVKAGAGRLFSSEEDSRNAEATVVLSWGLWKRRYGGAASVVGSKILLDARPFTVIGVLPARFTYPDDRVQLWTALYHERSPELMRLYEAHNFDVVGRLKPGVSMQQAAAEVSAIQAQIRKQHPDGPVNDAAVTLPLLDAQVRDVKLSFYALLAATGCLLLIACLNIANLLVARAAARQKEMAIRTALGGTRGRLIRTQVIESLVLAFAGGGLGLVFAYGALQWLVATRPDVPRADAIHIDAVTLAFTLGVICLCGLIAGLIPALSSSDRHVLKALQESARSHSGSRGGVRLRRVLLALEVGLTVVLLVGSGLLLKTYHQLRSVDMGANTHNVLTMTVNLPKGSYRNAPQLVSFYESLLQQVRALPGARGAGLSTGLPGQGQRRNDVFTIAENPPLPRGQTMDATTRFADPGYFSTLQIPLLQGRVFDDGERFDHAGVAVVSQAFVHSYFPNGDALGKHIVTELGMDIKKFEIVGMVGDTLEEAGDQPIPTFYFPLWAGSERSASLVVRTAQDPLTLALPVQRVIAHMDRDLPVADVLTMDQVASESLSDTSFDATLLAVFGTLSLLLAAVGLFGVLSYMVAQRTTEIGIRIALGAQREQVVRQFLSDGIKPAIYGLAVGLAASAMVTRLLSSMLYRTQALDPVVFVVVSATLLLVAALACVLPAWRASRLDPMQALRRE
jgi:predicted permease